LKSKIPLCFYPTQVVFVDDNEDFLSALTRPFTKQFNLKLFSDAQVALCYFNEEHLESREWNAVNKPELYGDSEKWVKQVLNRPSQKRLAKRENLDVSVLVVDYDMPGIDGISFCQQIKNPAIKKILLTGYATANDAVRAFNTGAIHYYVRKSDEDMLEQLATAITQLQHAYFDELTNTIKMEAVDSGTPFFADPALANYFQSVCDDLDIKEYYYISNPSRFALNAHDGAKSLCLIYSEADIEEHLTILSEEDAPSDLYEAIESRHYIPLFASEDGYYEPESFDASMQIYPAHKIEGKTNYYCAVIAEHETNVDLTTIIANSGRVH
jgi:CheY-like chemotaxis protein